MDLPGGPHLDDEHIQRDGEDGGYHQPEHRPGPVFRGAPHLAQGVGRDVALAHSGVKHKAEDNHNQQQQLLNHQDFGGQLWSNSAFVRDVPVKGEESVHLGEDNADVEGDCVVHAKEMNKTTVIVVRVKKRVEAKQRIVYYEQSGRGQNVEFKYVDRLQTVAVCLEDIGHDQEVEQGQGEGDDQVPVLLPPYWSQVVAGGVSSVHQEATIVSERRSGEESKYQIRLLSTVDTPTSY